MVSSHEEDRDDLYSHEVDTVDSLGGNIHVGDTGLDLGSPEEDEAGTLVEVGMGRNLDEEVLEAVEPIEGLDLVEGTAAGIEVLGLVASLDSDEVEELEL